MHCLTFPWTAALNGIYRTLLTVSVWPWPAEVLDRKLSAVHGISVAEETQSQHVSPASDLELVFACLAQVPAKSVT